MPWFKLLFILLLPIQVWAQGLSDYIVTNTGVPVKFVVSQSNDRYGTIIIAHGCKGVTRHEETVATRIAQQGFNTVVVDSWKYRNIGHVCENNAVEGHQRLEEIYKTVTWINQQPWHTGKIFLLGYSHGGKVALAASKNGPEKGISKSVAFYPYCFPSDHTEPKIPTQVHIGASDDWTPAHRCRGMFDGLFKPYKNGEYFEYPNAHHGFDLWGVDRVVQGMGQGRIITNRTIRFNREATVAAYTRTMNFFKSPD